MARLALVAAAAAALAGCRSEAESFSLHLSWSPGPAQTCPDVDGAVGCDAIKMSCDARVLVRIVPSDDGVAYYSHCFKLSGVTDACALADLDLQSDEPIPNEMVKVQVAVWSEDQLAGLMLDDDACPDVPAFDDFGLPLIQTTLAPALGGQIYFPVGDRRVADVELGCPHYDLLDTEACRVGAPVIRSTVHYAPGGGVVLDAAADGVAVKYGAPSSDGTGWKLATGDLDDLMPVGGDQGVWTGRLQRGTPDVGCVEVEKTEAFSTASATCHDAEVVAGEIAADGFVVDTSLVLDMMRALDLRDFPSEGLVLGVVVDDHAPVNGATVTASSPTAQLQYTVKYPDDDLTTTGLGSTASRGLFLSTDAPFDAVWSAVDTSGIADDGTARGGLIADHVSVVVIKIGPHVGGARAGAP